MRPLVPLAVMLAVPALAQTPPGHHLPGGAARPVRERQVDVEKVALDLRVDLAERSVSGAVTLEFTSLRDGLDRIDVDAAGLSVASVVAPPASDPLEFRVGERSIGIRLPRPLRVGEKGSVRIAYSGRPRSGLYFFPESSRGGAQAWNYGEGGLHYGFVPLYDDTNERFAVDLRLTVARPYVAVGNGTLVETRDEADGSRTFHWRQDEPIPNYLLAVDVGEFVEVPLEPARVGSRDVSVSAWGPPEDRDRIAFTFEDSPRMVEFFSDRFGVPYPWPKYHQITLRNFSGAMETTGMVGFAEEYRRGPDDPEGETIEPELPYFTWSYWDTVSHELAHHWFGDYVTCRSLGSLFLNESFASYAHTIWNGYAHGEDDMTYQRWRYLNQYLDYVRATGEVRPLEYAHYDDFGAMYQRETTYLKGALVLHMLRRVVGDDAFYRSLAGYLKSHAFSSVDSRDLEESFERHAGRNLDWFFSDWIAGGGGHPRFAISTRWSPERHQVDLTVEQQQADLPFEDAFRMPLEVVLIGPTGSARHAVEVRGWRTTVSLPAEAEPEAVVFDAGNWVVSELSYARPLREVLVQLERGDLAARLRAARQLRDDFPRRPEAIAALAARLADPGTHWGLRLEAAMDLGAMGGEAAVRALVAAAGDSDRRVRRGAAVALGTAGGDAAAAALRGLVQKDAAEEVVAVASAALGRMHAPGAAAFLAAQLERDSRFWDLIRVGALQGLARLDDAWPLQRLVRFTDARFPASVRQAALAGWSRVPAADRAGLAARLRELAGDLDREVRGDAIGALGGLGRGEDQVFLEGLAASEPDPSLAERARAAADAIRTFASTSGR